MFFEEIITFHRAGSHGPNWVRPMKYFLTTSASALLAYNVTFTTFQLSGKCLSESWLHLPFAALSRRFRRTETLPDSAEYVTLQSSLLLTSRRMFRSVVFFYCLQRPQWSVFTGYKLVVTYFPCCTCYNRVSVFEFEYQVLKSQTTKTLHEDYFLVVHARDIMLKPTVFTIYSMQLHEKLYSASTIILKVYNHQSINIWVSQSHKKMSWKPVMTARVLLLNSSNYFIALREIGHKHIVSYHQCYLLYHVHGFSGTIKTVDKKPQSM